jgi:serine/threonine protein kinase/tetratricopeptide (TPR) repeat protein
VDAEHNRAKSIFLSAADMACAAQREAFLGAQCGGDAALRREVEELLQHQPQARAFLEAPALDLLAGSDEPVSERPGTVIGPYKLLEQIGEGGFGIVFMAEQQKPIHRKVAVKVIKPGMDSRQVIARFEAERQALALMDHPNIAKVLDAGQTTSGRPYFVMDLIKGVPITDYCDQSQLTSRERLELFVSVCQGVQHAHQKGIIHRDIKPTNVLVTLQDGGPLVKVIDFGVAKALGQHLTDKTLFTGFAEMVGTPLYMSPEQAALSNVDVDTRSDIYALGVLLYELLTGTTPFDKERLKDAGYDEMRRIIREEEPPRPSTRISTLGPAAVTVSSQRKSDPKRLSQLFRGELDWIVMKCLEKDRNRRYETANGLARDIQRYLQDEPVQACPPSAWYRFGKLARRNKAALAITACALLALAVLLGSVGWAVRDREAREQEIELKETQQRNEIDREVSRALDEAEARIKAGKWADALEPAERAENLLAAAGRSERGPRLVELRQDLAMAGRLDLLYNRPTGEESFFSVKRQAEYLQAFQDYGIDLAALPVAEAAHRIRARGIKRELAQALDCMSAIQLYVQRSRPDMGKLLAVARAVDPDPWRDQLRALLGRGDRSGLEALAAATDVRRVPPWSLHLLGQTLAHFAKGQDKAIALLSRAHSQYPEDPWISEALGSCCYQLGRYGEAARYLSAAVAARPHRPDLRYRLGLALEKIRAFQEALEEYSRTIELKSNFPGAVFKRGTMYHALNRPEEALADFSQLIRLGDESAGVRYYLGWAESRLRRWERALVEFSRALELAPEHAQARQGRAYCYSVAGQWDKAAADLSARLRPEPLGSAPLDDTWFQFACLGLLQSDVPGYEHLCQQLLVKISRTKQGFTGSYAFLAGRCCLLHPTEGVPGAQALVWAEKAVADGPRVPWYLHTLALAHYRAGHFEQTLRYCRESQQADPRWGGVILNQLLEAMAHQGLGQHEEARKCRQAAAQWRETAVDGTPAAGAACPPDMHLNEWLEFEVLFREAEALLGKGDVDSLQLRP